MAKKLPLVIDESIGRLFWYLCGSEHTECVNARLVRGYSTPLNAVSYIPLWDRQKYPHIKIEAHYIIRRVFDPVFYTRRVPAQNAADQNLANIHP